jgi:orotate phosphoribosyltransferase
LPAELVLLRLGFLQAQHVGVLLPANQSKKPLLAAERRPLALKLTMIRCTPNAQFLELALAREVLRFGEFTLKSGRTSPYFFNAGRFDGARRWPNWRVLRRRAGEAGVAFDMLFGPAYKGIPLATALATANGARGRDVPVAFNRKEAKAHGEGGTLIGAPLAGRVLIVDDVITAGTAIRERSSIIREAGGDAGAVVIALDRQERGQEGIERSAAQEVEAEFGLPVLPSPARRSCCSWRAKAPDLAGSQAALLAYRARYGSSGTAE